MDQTSLRAWEAQCIQEEPPRCEAGCPLGVDCRGFLAAMTAHDLKKARSILEKRLPLPEITGRLCEAPCEQYCLRTDFGGAVAVGLLERYCIEHRQSSGRVFTLPPKSKKVLLVGGGPSSLTAAFDLGKKGYPVTLLHLDNSPGAWLHRINEEILPQNALEKEMQRLQSLGVTFCSVPSLDEHLITKTDYDAIYIGGDDILSEPLITLSKNSVPETFVITDGPLFAGGLAGENHPYRYITNIFQGRQAALSIDRFLQGASLTTDRPAVRNGRTALYTNTAEVVSSPRIIPEQSGRYSEAEAQEEARRCINCQCLECVKSCVYLQEFGSYPKVYARQIYNNAAIVKGIHQANLLIDSCSLCGQCEELCPQDFSMTSLCLTARQQMVTDGRMPASAHWFALEEMHSAAEEGALLRHIPGFEKSEALFFPGCQLAGLRPEQTLKLYDALLKREPYTGIWLDCCRVPAYWGGRQEEFSKGCDQLRTLWSEAGQPKVICACTTCIAMFRDHLPEIPVELVWNIIPRKNNTETKRPGTKKKVAVSDPCSARHDSEVQHRIRALLGDYGYYNEELAFSGKKTECCGFGGLMENANPDLAGKAREHRVAQSDTAIVTYCAMCRDQLAKSGHPVLHILDILYPETASSPEAPALRLSDRRINRRKLKQTILERFPQAKQPQPPPWEAIKLVIDPTASEQMEERRILEDDIRRVLAYAGDRGQTFCHEDGVTKISSMRLGEVTFWVQYKEDAGAYIVTRCWSHRMHIAGRRS
ncbi:MAG: hypothetical protein CSA21_07505 [Deltaproteobacteria bacterium]|nr:MAG: hypothetical protein CSA21_07505 [Deltaproteobacteria bacterium]